MNIGEAARISGVSAKMIRHYEGIGLIPGAARSGAGYRQYGPAEVNTLRFIARARGFGLPMERIRALVGLWQDRTHRSRDVKALALAHVRDLRAQAARLTAMADALQRLADECRGDHRPECPILLDLEMGPGAAAPATSGQS